MKDQVGELKMLINAYRKRYGDLDLSKYIKVTKTNKQTTLIDVNDIIRFVPVHGIYNDVEYNTKLVCKDHTHYVVETVGTVSNLYKNAKVYA